MIAMDALLIVYCLNHHQRRKSSSHQSPNMMIIISKFHLTRGVDGRNGSTGVPSSLPVHFSALLMQFDHHHHHNHYHRHHHHYHHRHNNHHHLHFHHQRYFHHDHRHHRCPIITPTGSLLVQFSALLIQFDIAADQCAVRVIVKYICTNWRMILSKRNFFFSVLCKYLHIFHNPNREV